MREPFLTFWPSYVWTVIWLTGCAYATGVVMGAVVFAVHFFDTGTLFHPPTGDPAEALLVLAFPMIYVLAGSCVLTWLSRIFVNADGVGCRDSLSRYREVAWSAVTSVRRFNMLGLNFLLVSAQNLPRPLWLPLFLARPLQFEQAVWHYAGPENPVTREITRTQA